MNSQPTCLFLNCLKLMNNSHIIKGSVISELKNRVEKANYGL